MKRVVNPPMTIRDLKAAISSLNDDAWVCLPAGPLTKVTCEPGANEPFVLLKFVPEKALA